jgi:hypothetical protein
MHAVNIFLMIENRKDSTLFRLISYVANAETRECPANALRVALAVTRPAPAADDEDRWGEGARAF